MSRSKPAKSKVGAVEGMIQRTGQEKKGLEVRKGQCGGWRLQDGCWGIKGSAGMARVGPWIGLTAKHP